MPNAKKMFLAVLLFLLVVLTGRASKASNESSLPLSIKIVPSTSQPGPSGALISMSNKSPRTFYVVLTNSSNSKQAVFEEWNSWGYQAVSLELRTMQGQTFTVSRKPQSFSRNFPSTFTIAPGEQMVFPITLDDRWEAVPALPWADETPMEVTVKAIYEVHPTAESTREEVWVGRLESSEYHFNLRHWK